MRKSDGYKYDFMRRAKQIESKVVECKVDETPVMENHDPSAPLLKVIYSVDSSGLPTGDLKYYVSPKANPEVKKWILDNLMFDTSSAQNVKIPDGLDSDTAFALQRCSGESVESYADRINRFAQDNLSYVQEQYNMISNQDPGNAPSE